ncbi:MAG: N-acetylmuramoyl-L-alanine amidase, partial [Candidatus Binatia bacterium]
AGAVVGAALLALLLGACAQLPEYTRLRVVQHPSINFNERRPSFVILHHTGNLEAKRALDTLSNPVLEVSAHYLVARDGMIYYLVDEMKRAWHAGDSWWGGPLDMNSASIGIELDNDGSEPYAESQIAALLALLADLEQRYGIPAKNFIGHGDIAPGRKIDPSVEFPWRRLAEHGFGLWCEPPFEPAPPGRDTGALLGAFGYDVSSLDAAIGAFNRHFAGVESPRMTDEGRARLYSLVLKKWAGSAADWVRAAAASFRATGPEHGADSQQAAGPLAQITFRGPVDPGCKVSAYRCVNSDIEKIS